MKVRAAVLHRPGDELEIVEAELREPGPGEVRVRVDACGICRSDLHVAQTGESTAASWNASFSPTSVWSRCPPTSHPRHCVSSGAASPPATARSGCRRPRAPGSPVPPTSSPSRQPVDQVNEAFTELAEHRSPRPIVLPNQH